MLALTEPSSELLNAQLPGASSIQPIKEQLQLLCAARDNLLLQFLTTNRRTIEQLCWKEPYNPPAPSLTCISARVMNPSVSPRCSWITSWTFCITAAAHGGSSAASLRSCRRRLDPMRRPLEPTCCSAMAHSGVLQRGTH